MTVPMDNEELRAVACLCERLAAALHDTDHIVTIACEPLMLLDANGECIGYLALVSGPDHNEFQYQSHPNMIEGPR